MAVVIEKVNGQLYSEYLEDLIFIPAGMQSSTVFTVNKNPEEYENVAKGYTYNESKMEYQEASEDKNHDLVFTRNQRVSCYFVQ